VPHWEYSTANTVNPPSITLNSNILSVGTHYVTLSIKNGTPINNTGKWSSVTIPVLVSTKLELGGLTETEVKAVIRKWRDDLGVWKTGNHYEFPIGGVNLSGDALSNIYNWIVFAIDDANDPTVVATNPLHPTHHPGERFTLNLTGSNGGTTKTIAGLNSVTASKSLLTGITLPNGLTTIGANAFNGFDQLTAITIPASVTAIGANAFKDTTNLTTVNFKHGLEATTVVNGVFDGSAVTTINVPSNAGTNYLNALKVDLSLATKHVTDGARGDVGAITP
jgi:hypothetical protein